MSPEESRPVRAAIVGAGLMGRWHADAIAGAGGVVVAIADPDVARRDALRRGHPGATVADSLDAFLLAPDPAEVVHICTPLDTHEPLTRLALERGAHVIVEKPLAPDLAVTRDLLALADARRRLLCPVHQFCFQRGVLDAEVALPRLGALLHIDATMCSAGAEHGAAPDAVVADVLPHPLSLIARLSGVGLAAAEWSVVRRHAGEWRVSGALGATTLSIVASMAGRPTTNTMRCIAARGTVHLDLFHGFMVGEDGAVSRARKIAHPFALAAHTFTAAASNLIGRTARGEAAYPGMRELVARVYRAVRLVQPSPISPAETMDIADARDRLIALAGLA